MTLLHRYDAPRSTEEELNITACGKMNFQGLGRCSVANGLPGKQGALNFTPRTQVKKLGMVVCSGDLSAGEEET